VRPQDRGHNSVKQILIDFSLEDSSVICNTVVINSPTTPCHTTLWNINQKKQAINNKLQGRVATYLRCSCIGLKQTWRQPRTNRRTDEPPVMRVGINQNIWWNSLFCNDVKILGLVIFVAGARSTRVALRPISVSCYVQCRPKMRPQTHGYNSVKS